jgi:uncharacterized protein (TIGR02147 family)
MQFKAAGLRVGKEKKPIWDFTDYRAFLKDVIAAAKAGGQPISNRWIARELGINSTSYATLLLQGKRNLNRINAGKLSRLLGLSKSESNYFEALVEFNQAGKPEDRDRASRNLLALQRRRGDPQRVDPDRYHYYGEWYHSVVRALAHLLSRSGNYEELGSMLIPPISAAQARKSVELLEKLGFIGKNGRGGWEVLSPSITTGEGIRSLQVANFQRETLRLAWEALDRVPKELRDISTLTVGISENGFREIRDLIKRFREQVDEVVRRDAVEDRVYQLNLQLFPLSRPPKKPVGEHG